MKWPESVTIVEVGPRDGLQSETSFVPTNIKLNFIEQLTSAGLPRIEITSFSSKKQVPQLADHETILKQAPSNSTCHYPVIVPTPQAAETAINQAAKQLAVLASSSEGFSQHNTNCSIDEGLNRIQAILDLAQANHISVRAYLSCAIACPYDGKTNPEYVASLVKQLIEMGCYEVSLSDTIGVATPKEVSVLLNAVLNQIKPDQCAVHFHDTYGQAIANIYEALQHGITVIDSSVAGLGGCPYAKGATGNVATEDVLYLLQGLNISTGIDLKSVAQAGQFICDYLNQPNRSKVAQVLLNTTP